MSGLARAQAAFDQRFDPVNRAIDELLSFETPARRWLRENSAAISKAHAEMMAEKAAELVTADPEPPLSSERSPDAGADLAPGSGAREGSGTNWREASRG